MHPHDARKRRPDRVRFIVIVATLVMLALTALFYAAGVFDQDPMRIFRAKGTHAPVGAVFFSGDMGLRYGMGAATAPILAAHGVQTVGFNSPTLFLVHRSPAETGAIIAQAVRDGLARAGTDRIVLIGQSYGADVLQLGLSDLPVDLRRHVAAVILVVPGKTVFLRADPSGLSYHGVPDADGAISVNRIDWVQLTCIYGRRETDSLCPLIRVPNAHIVAMPGGHFLGNDAAALSAEVLHAISQATA